MLQQIYQKEVLTIDLPQTAIRLHMTVFIMMTQQEQSVLAHGLLTLSFPIIVPQDVKMHTFPLLPEHRSSSDQLVQVRCMHGRSTVRSDFWPQIVHSEEEEVLLERRWRLGDRQQRKKQHANEKRKTLGSHDCRGQESFVMVFFFFQVLTQAFGSLSC